ncbi:hypothetical protein K440DRAFT_646639 [Wilcoxina mikolae CBS 423.85]|nr:hypothetical protein K440DRAFT_646639 [Wilcoxina mikolae CBS 423.85]
MDSSGRIREMVKQHNTAQNNKDCATKKLGYYWHQSPELLEILNEGDGTTRTAKYPQLAKLYLNYAYVSHIINLGWTSKVNRWFTSADFKEAKGSFEKGCPVVNQEINLEIMGSKLYRGVVMPVAYYLFLEEQCCTRTHSLSAPPPNHLIPSALIVLISSAEPTEEDSTPKIPDIPDTTLNDVTEVVDDATEVIDEVTEGVDEDDEATSSDNESSENDSSKTAVSPTALRTKASHKRKRAGRPPSPNRTKDRPIDA